MVSPKANIFLGDFSGYVFVVICPSHLWSVVIVTENSSGMNTFYVLWNKKCHDEMARVYFLVLFPETDRHSPESVSV